MQIGQLFMTGIEGHELTKEESHFIEKNDIGGVILFSKNYEGPAQLAELINSIQQLRKEYPLYIATDHEGGRVIRFKQNFTQFPSMLDMAKFDSAKKVFEMAQIMALELSACGVNLNLSPCCDILINQNNKVIGDRSFGNTAKVVEKYVSSVIRGLQTNNVMSCAKHFPGHGRTTKDSHYDLPILKCSLEDLKQNDFIPFQKAIKSKVEMVMMAHLMVDCIDDKLPTSLSPLAYEVLRKDFRFDRPIITDDMQMEAITKFYSIDEASTKALVAGADIVEFRNFEQCRTSFEYFQKALADKSIDPSTIKEKVERINKSKKSSLSNYKPVYLPDINKAFSSDKSRQLVEEIQQLLEK
jgi:beta-N-acetylhexosaminidase